MSKFSRAAKEVKESPLAIPLTLVFVALFIISLYCSYEDFTTSKLGYQEIPTRKANAGVVTAVALIPQLGQIGLAYAWGKEYKSNRKVALLSLIAVAGLHFVDVGTDVYYKANGLDLWIWVAAIVESEIIYTLGSEVLFTISFGMLINIIPDFVGQVSILGQRMGDALDRLDGNDQEEWETDLLDNSWES